ncbi:hypothetical protein EVAR_9551_1 [Eumeta japonica]|uniref:Uncharacterized protein n=1 Tax=Eumeta variegata TaxID=151549 RepID=A0A4C1U421_EUMVA|nr:hypothetical protein EVAR_9551_1 [Eumeta japonica]
MSSNLDQRSKYQSRLEADELHYTFYLLLPISSHNWLVISNTQLRNIRQYLKLSLRSEIRRVRRERTTSHHHQRRHVPEPARGSRPRRAQ